MGSVDRWLRSEPRTTALHRWSRFGIERSELEVRDPHANALDTTRRGGRDLQARRQRAVDADVDIAVCPDGCIAADRYPFIPVDGLVIAALDVLAPIAADGHVFVVPHQLPPNTVDPFARFVAYGRLQGTWTRSLCRPEGSSDEYETAGFMCAGGGKRLTWPDASCQYTRQGLGYMDKHLMDSTEKNRRFKGITVIAHRLSYGGDACILMTQQADQFVLSFLCK